jgi:c-di-GMP-binding flagellar brake protein YcgR
MMSAPDHPPDLAHRDDLPGRFAVHSRTEILFLLRAIQKRKLLVNLDLSDSSQCVITSVLAVDEANNALIIDCARDDALNQELMSGRGAGFSCSLDGVSITFAIGAARACDFEKLPALRVALPASLIRLQRREHFRVQLPITNPVKCIVPPMHQHEGKPITANIIDIGCGGVAIAETSGRLGTETGRTLLDCHLLLPDLERVTASLEVWNSVQVRLQNGAFQTRLGCKFIDLPHDRVATLQRFIMDMERARRNTL